LAARLHRMHAEHGVAVEVGRAAWIEHRDADGGAALPAAHRLHLHDGRTVDADVVVLAGGTVPDTALAEDAGLEV
ncbi:nitrite reductase, partial [Salmonella enterica subsp. enterica serovar Typhimurium]|nr:nitrite reductase [Salmonella enterica subsp. enterica serovar Typhimurium]